MNNNVTKKSNGGLLIGLILIVVGIIVLWYNEGRTVKTMKTIGEAEQQYIDVDSSKIDSANNGKLVATTGKLQIPNTGVADNSFGVQITGAKLKRTVEMYQWKETCRTDDNNNTRCTYDKVWDEEVINSNNFENINYSNPNYMPYESDTFYAQNVKVGSFNLDNELLSQLSTKSKINVSDNSNTQQMGLIANGNYYTDVQNDTPQIGDIRISFTYNDASNVSVLAVQNNNSFSKFTSSSGYSIYELQEGNLNGKEMLAQLTSENNSTKWILRLIGTLLIIFGFAAIIAPLQRLANFIPIFGTIFGWISGFITFVLGLGISLIVIALAWLRYRPVFSIGLLVGVIVILMLLKKKKTKQTANNQNNIINQSNTPNMQQMNNSNTLNSQNNPMLNQMNTVPTNNQVNSPINQNMVNNENSNQNNINPQN